MDRWNAHVDPASGTTYDVTERSGVTLPKEGSANGTPSSGASPLKIALGVVAAVVLACILPADSAIRGAIPLSFPVLSPGGVRSDHAVDLEEARGAAPLEESQRRLLLRRRESRARSRRGGASRSIDLTLRAQASTFAARPLP